MRFLTALIVAVMFLATVSIIRSIKNPPVPPSHTYYVTELGLTTWRYHECEFGVLYSAGRGGSAVMNNLDGNPIRCIEKPVKVLDSEVGSYDWKEHFNREWENNENDT